MYILQNLVDAFSLGSLYALCALGIGLIFGIMRLINFAYGEFITFGAYALVIPTASAVAQKFIGGFPAPLLIAAIIAVVVLLAIASEWIAFRPLRRREAAPATLLVSSFAISYFLQNFILFVHSGRPKSVNIFPDLTAPLDVMGLRVPIIDVVTIATGFLLVLALWLFLRRTMIGIQMLAAAEDFRMARLLGVRADRVIAVAFAITGILAAVVSLLIVTKSGVLDFRMGVPLVIFAFVATVIGGMGSLVGAVLGGYLLGILSVLLQALLPAELRPARDAFLFGVVIIVLLFRPHGLIRARATLERV